MTGQIIPLSKKPRIWKDGGIWCCANIRFGFFGSARVVKALGLTPSEAYKSWSYKRRTTV